jgi:hypothetical protein
MIVHFDILWIAFMKDIIHKTNMVFSSCLLAAMFVCSSCGVSKQASLQTVFHPQGDSKLRQKAALLQKKLDNAQRTLSEDEKTIERLRSQLCDAELNAIESKVESFENQWRTNPQRLIQCVRPEFAKVFLDEREALSRIIHKGPDVRRAQALLDRVLQLITQLSDAVPISAPEESR